MMAESAYQQYERLLRIIEATTREEGFEPPPRRRLESLVSHLDSSHKNGILAGSVRAYYDPGMNGIRSREG